MGLRARKPNPNHYIGKDTDSLACLLIATADGAARSLPPIRLETLDVQFDLACHVKKDQEPKREDTFTVIRCRTPETETVRYFLSVCESILRILGDAPTSSAVGAAVNRMAAIFATERPHRRAVLDSGERQSAPGNARLADRRQGPV
jgi:hypothetical protein